MLVKEIIGNLANQLLGMGVLVGFALFVYAKIKKKTIIEVLQDIKGLFERNQEGGRFGPEQ